MSFYVQITYIITSFYVQITLYYLLLPLFTYIFGFNGSISCFVRYIIAQLLPYFTYVYTHLRTNGCFVRKKRTVSSFYVHFFCKNFKLSKYFWLSSFTSFYVQKRFLLRFQIVPFSLIFPVFTYKTGSKSSNFSNLPPKTSKKGAITSF